MSFFNALVPLILLENCRKFLLLINAFSIRDSVLYIKHMVQNIKPLLHDTRLMFLHMYGFLHCIGAAHTSRELSHIPAPHKSLLNT